MMKNASILSFFLLPCVLFAQSADEVNDKIISKIAFGSCSKQDQQDRQLWSEINALQPDLWVWLGDNIYGDTEDMQVLEDKYDLQKSHAGYQQLIKNTDVIGIWDDHDYGINDGGKEYAKKEESKAALFRFLDVSADHPARGRNGAHQSYLYRGEKNIKLILLDARYGRDPLLKDDNNTNIPSPAGKVLDDAQWEWLATQLADSLADFFIIGSGIQVMPEEHVFEKWANFPSERAKLLDITSQVKAPLIFLSGDRHMSEVSTLTHKGKLLYEFTASSLTNPWRVKSPEPNRYREQEIVYQTNFAVMEMAWQGDRLGLLVRFIGKDNKVYQTHELSF